MHTAVSLFLHIFYIYIGSVVVVGGGGVGGGGDGHINMNGGPENTARLMK
jgi:hypothetical protein